MDDTERERTYEQVRACVPLGRVGAEDAAETYVHLMRQRHATGTVVTVDGGALLA